MNIKSQTFHPYVINLSPGFAPMPSNHDPLEFNLSTFPGGEPHFFFKNVPSNARDLVITQRYNTVADLMLIIIVNDAARRAGFTNIELVLPYFPGARQDRVCNPGEALTVKVFADLINGCNFSKVYIYSPHSEVTPAVINNVELIERDEKFLHELIVKCNYHTYKEINIVCPDAGAGKRVSKLAKSVATEFPKLKVNLIRCEKVRDVVTGELKEFFVQADNLDFYPTIICDDIVAYGGTFRGLGSALQKKSAGDLTLFTSHADCIEGLEAMAKYFTHVFTSNSKQDWTLSHLPPNVSDRFTCFKIYL
jgi:ribose-phosphate pyrophosphokinase